MTEYLSREEGTDSTEEGRDTLEQLNSMLVRLVDTLLDRLEGSETDYEYHYGEGWQEDSEKTAKERLHSDEWDEKIQAAEELLDRYSQ